MLLGHDARVDGSDRLKKKDKQAILDPNTAQPFSIFRMRKSSLRSNSCSSFLRKRFLSLHIFSPVLPSTLPKNITKNITLRRYTSPTATSAE